MDANGTLRVRIKGCIRFHTCPVGLPMQSCNLTNAGVTSAGHIRCRDVCILCCGGTHKNICVMISHCESETTLPRIMTDIVSDSFVFFHLLENCCKWGRMPPEVPL
eukprot:1144448-Pelagomonas_calceolata.AAC.3